MPKQYTYTQYCRDGRIAVFDSENLGSFGKIEALKQYGHKNLRGGLPEAPVRELSLDYIISCLENSAEIANFYARHRPDVPVTAELLEKAKRKLISRVNKAFRQTYDDAVNRVRQYGASFGHSAPAPKPMPKPVPKPADLEKRTQQCMFDTTPTETSHLRPDGRRKR